MAQNASTQPETLKELSHSIARQLAAGKSHGAVIQELIARGWPESVARQFVTNADHLSSVYQEIAAQQHSQADKYRSVIIRAGLWTVAGLGIIGVSLIMQDPALSFCQFALGVSVTIVESIDCLRGLNGWWEQRTSKKT